MCAVGASGHVVLAAAHGSGVERQAFGPGKWIGRYQAGGVRAGGVLPGRRVEHAGADGGLGHARVECPTLGPWNDLHS